MKKLMILLLSVIWLLSPGGAALAASFSDTGSLSQSTRDSISRLTELEVLSGYPDGTFRPQGAISRAEFAKIAVLMGGQEGKAGQMADDAADFSDVKSGEWYTGWINAAAAGGYVQGYGDGSFRPDAEISYAQVLTVLLRVLGYDDRLPGDWPADYLASANSLALTQGLVFSPGAAASRADVAVLADALLDLPLVKWDSLSQTFINSSSPAVTLLAANFPADEETPAPDRDAKLAAILDVYFIDGDSWVEIDLLGQSSAYAVRGTTVPVDGSLYTYSLSGGKFSPRTHVFDPADFQATASFTGEEGQPGSLSGKTYARVTDIDARRDAIQINGDWYFIDDETDIYDYSDWYDDGKDPVFLANLGDIEEDDLIVYVDNGDGKNVAKLLILVSNIAVDR